MKTVNILSRTFIGISAFSLFYVTALAWMDPRAVMQLVNVSLDNTDAISSIRGVYGGVGLTIVISLVYLAVVNVRQGLVFLIMLWGFYALSRMTTSVVDGSLGDFGTRWLMIESVFAGIAIVLLFVHTRQARQWATPVHA